MATKTSRASNAQKRMVKNQKRAAMAQKRNAQAQQIKAKASVNNFSNPKTNNMGKTNTIGVIECAKMNLDNLAQFYLNYSMWLDYEALYKKEGR